MRILITGGAGFIGQHVAVMLASEHELVAVDSLNAQVHQHAEAAVQRFPGQVVIADVSQASTWDALPGFDVVVHLAAETGTAQSMYEAERYRAVNVEGTRLAAAAAASWGAALVALSSRAVYGEGRYECRRHGTRFGARCCPQAEAAPSREEDPHRPVSVYGETKSEAEAILAEYAAATGRDLTGIGFWHVLGLWKIAIIGEGVVRRATEQPDARSLGQLPTRAELRSLVDHAHATADVWHL